MHQRGFTLLEVLLSVAIITALIGLSLPIYQSFQSRNNLDAVTQRLVEALRRAQTYARAGKQDSAWSVRIQPSLGSFYVYQGSDFTNRDTGFDEPVSLDGVTPTNALGDITFGKLNGNPSATGSISLAGQNNETRTVTINAKGMVSY